MRNKNFLRTLWLWALLIVTGNAWAQITTQDDFVTACANAASGDVITLGNGEFAIGPVDINGKTLTFKGQGATNTKIYIGNGGYDGNGGHGSSKTANMTFEDLTLDDLASNSGYLTGFTEAAGLTFRNVTFNVGFSNWGNKAGDVSFYNCTFNQTTSGKYCIQELRSANGTKYLFDGCTFNCTVEGRFINAYKQGGQSTKIEIICKNCTFNNTGSSSKAVFNLKDESNGCSIDLTFIGTNNATGAFPSSAPSALFQTTSTGWATVYLKDNDDATPIKIYENNTKTSSWVEPNGYVATPPAPVAKIGETGYTTLADAITAATSGQTITILADIEDAGNINLPAGVTFDGDNHKISGNSSIHINAAGGSVKNVNFENIHNTSTPSDTEISKYKLPADKVGTLSAIYANGLTGESSITGCSFDNVDWDAIQITPTEGCTISIVDNTFRHTNAETSQLRYVHIETASYIDASVTVTDNKFYNSNSDYTICDLGVYKVRKSQNAHLCGNWLETITNYDMTYPEMIYPARSQADVDVDDICPAAKKVVTPIQFYNTLQEAFDALVDLQLVKNTDEDVTVPASYNKQLQTDGFSINSTITNNGALYIIASNSDEACTGKIINNGSLKSSNLANLNGLQIVNNGKLEITGSTNAADLSKITNNEGGKIEISGGKYSTKPNDEWILWGYEAVDNGDGTFTVQKRTFANDEDAVAAGAIAKYTKSSVTEYINTLANGGTSSLHFLKDITEDVVRTGSSSTYFYADDFKYTGSLDATGKTVNVKSGKAEFNSLKCSAFNVGATNTGGVEVTVHDGKVTGKVTVYSPAVLKIDGGTFTNTSATAVTVNSGATLIITGGTFNVDPTAYVVKGYAAKDNGNGTWTVSEKPVSMNPTTTTTTTDNGTTTETKTTSIGTAVTTKEGETVTASTVTPSIAVDLTGISNADIAKNDAINATQASDDVKAQMAALDAIQNTLNNDAVEAFTATNMGAATENYTQANSVDVLTTFVNIQIQNAAVNVENTEGVVNAIVTAMEFEVKPTAVKTDGTTEIIPNEQITAPITFRLPVDKNCQNTVVEAYHISKENSLGFFPVITEGENKFVELSAKQFSVYGYLSSDAEVKGNVYAGSSAVQTAQTLAQFATARTSNPNAIMIVDEKYANLVTTETNVVVEYAVGSGHYYECPKFVLTDMSDFFSPVDFIASTGSYSRQPNAYTTSTIEYNSVCLPFAISATDLSSTARILTFSYYDGDKTVYFNNMSGVSAGTPCIIHETGTSWNAITFSNTPIVASPKNDGNMKGTFTNTTQYGGSGTEYYSVNTENKFQTLTSNLSPFRSCLYIHNDGSIGQQNSSVKKIIVIEDGDNATAIHSTRVDKDNCDTAIYTLSGTKVGDSEKNLPSGLYIKNGKKFIVK